MIRKLKVAFTALILAGSVVCIVTLTRPPAYDGVWLLAIVLMLGALACSAAIALITTRGREIDHD